MKNWLGRAAFGVVLTFTAVVMAADWPPHVTAVTVQKGKSVTVPGRLESGAPMSDLTWAASSSMACFPATQNDRFRGHHVLHHTQLPDHAIMTITVAPKDPTKDLSLYAYTIGTTNTSIPPNVSSAVSCEADYKWDHPKRGQTQDHTRTVKLTSVTNPYNVVIGVAGAKGVTAGDFDLKVDLQ